MRHERRTARNAGGAKVALGLLAVGGLLALAGCGGGGAPSGAAAGAGDDSAASPETVDLRAPTFSLRDTEGEVVSMADFDGKVRLIDFWATWCAPCREEVPMLNELYQTYNGDGLEILAIADVSDSMEGVRAFAAAHDVRYVNLIGEDDVVSQYQVMGLPTAFLVDRDGRIVESYFGPKPRRQLEEKIRELLDLHEPT